ncbi:MULTISPECIES: Sec-independent protein translocase subunit TatA [unclassified Streptomyces]|uniref:Sec-independent protein translocase subunit TatA n=1 Tax=unclassified Streptomyces TaxID=2593676 RepID=UPI001661AD37|nr:MULTISPECIES: Sec-independent protein translocase subunit TatA [unclassified Streptomyces]MBD0842264.1 Sec-independent protein translocase subunit TatA [Streptomyces sp. TRM68416]
MFGLSELAVILIVVILVIGAKKLPDLARSAGKSARILKAEAKAMKDEQTGTDADTAPRMVQGETITPGTNSPTDPGQPPSPGSERSNR